MTVFVPSGLRVAQEVRYGASGQTLTWICEVDGHRVTPGASPAIAIYRPGASEETDSIATGTGTVSGTSITYALDASSTTTFPFQRNYRAKATWTNGGKTYTTNVMFSVVRNPVTAQIPVNENDLIAAHVRIEEALNQVGRLGYSGAYYIQEAFAEVVRYLASTGINANEVMPREDLSALCLPLARAKLCRSLMTGAPSDPWAMLADTFAAEYESAKKITPMGVAHGDSNVPTQERSWQQPTLSAAPDWVRVRGNGGARARW